ncbi:MAG: endolytic transglycosylase MltG [Bacillota bacterium]|nr:endolytic transglycosylase MltG [Bacillota bacterium]
MIFYSLSDTVKPSRKTWKIVFIILGLMLIAAALAGWFGYNYYQQGLEPVAITGVDQKVTIPAGASTVRIANILLANGLIKDEVSFRIYTRVNGFDGRMKAGEYTFNDSMSVAEIVDIIVSGNVVTYPFTIPEGYTLKQIARVLSDKGMVNEEKFWSLLEEGEFNFPYMNQLLAGPNRFEGFLFPDTYHIPSYMTEQDIIQMMLNRFLQVVDADMVKRAEERGLSLMEYVTIASIIEREASADVDRPKIAGVIYNRLELGMPLQIDATVIYAHGEHIQRVLFQHLEIDSPYNTYKYAGIPPGPIAAPGEKSFEAAVTPEEHGFYFYVLKPDGTHHFSKTLTEHNRAVQEYLRSR